MHHVKQSRNKFSLYKKCVDVILKIQKIKPVRKIKFSSNKYLNLNSYNTSKFTRKESDLFFDWYLPGVIGKKKSSKYKKIIKEGITKTIQKNFF